MRLRRNTFHVNVCLMQLWFAYPSPGCHMLPLLPLCPSFGSPQWNKSSPSHPGCMAEIQATEGHWAYSGKGKHFLPCQAAWNFDMLSFVWSYIDYDLHAQQKNLAATKIQALVRKFILRRMMIRQNKAAIKIQTFWRGCSAREKLRALKKERYFALQNAAATIIQVCSGLCHKYFC